LAAQCLRWLAAKGAHEECGLRLTSGVNIVAVCRRRNGHDCSTPSIIVPPGLHTIADAVVPDSWHTIAAALIEFTGSFLPPSFYQGGK
jgi:hypothetical protein